VKKRCTVKVALCLLAGAVVTWAVCWWSAVRGVEPGRTAAVSVTLEDRVIRWGSRRRTILGEEWRLALPRGMGGERRHVEPPRWVGAFPDSDYTESVAVGLPLRAMAMRRAVVAQPAGLQLIVDGAFVWWRDGWPQPLPTQVLPLGFALDTLLAAGVVLGVVEGVRFARRRSRQRRGRCPKCGYDRRGLASHAAACPECGTAVGTR